MSEPQAQPQAERPPGTYRRHYWDRFTTHMAGREGAEGDAVHSDPAQSKLPPGEDLAALRRGANREAGSVPEMWRFHNEFDDSGAAITPRLRAEHHALTLFGFHQQSMRQPVNVPGRSVGAAMLQLRNAARFSEDAIDGRFTAAATSDTVDGLAVHLRGLVGLLKRERIGFDYAQLFIDLVAWQYPESRARVRRKWAADYFRQLVSASLDESPSPTA